MYVLVTLFEKLEFTVQVYHKYPVPEIWKSLLSQAWGLSTKSIRTTLVVATDIFCETLVPVDYQSTRRDIPLVRTAHTVGRE